MIIIHEEGSDISGQGRAEKGRKESRDDKRKYSNEEERKGETMERKRKKNAMKYLHFLALNLV